MILLFQESKMAFNQTSLVVRAIEIIFLYIKSEIILMDKLQVVIDDPYLEPFSNDLLLR